MRIFSPKEDIVAITQNILNFDTYFSTTTGDKIIVNDLSPTETLQSDTLVKNLMTIYDNVETISSKPSCDCGKLQGMYLLGHLCKCGTTVKDINQKIDPVLWLRAFELGEHRTEADQFSFIPFMNTSFWMMVANVIDTRMDWLRYLADSQYKPGTIEIPDHVLAMVEYLGGRSYSLLISKLEGLLEFMLTLPKYKQNDKPVLIKGLLETYAIYKDDIYTRHLPIVNKKLFVMENTNKGKFVNLIAADVISVTKTWISTSAAEKPSRKRLENTTAAAISNLSKLYKDYFINYVGKKKGIFRKHVYGARSHFTFRAVIVSIPGAHDHNEVIIPWPIMVTVLRPFILNKLEKRGYTYKEADKILFRAVITYTTLIDEILQELIDEAPGGKLSLLQQRNLK